MYDAYKYMWEELHVFRQCADQLMRWRVEE